MDSLLNTSPTYILQLFEAACASVFLQEIPLLTAQTVAPEDQMLLISKGGEGILCDPGRFPSCC